MAVSFSSQQLLVRLQQCPRRPYKLWLRKRDDALKRSVMKSAAAAELRRASTWDGRPCALSNWRSRCSRAVWRLFRLYYQWLLGIPALPRKAREARRIESRCCAQQTRPQISYERLPRNLAIAP